MKLTIITPAFNAGDFIRACIENVQAQGPGVDEHIIADGGSTDGTLEIVAELQRLYPNVRLLPGPDEGQSDAMNKATAAARGDLIGVLNADDFYQPGVVAETLKMFEREPGLDFVAANTRVVGPDDELISWNCPRDLRPEILVWYSHHYPLPANPSAYFYTRAIHDRVGGYDKTNHYTMDIEFVFKVLSTGRFRYVDRHWGNFRLIPGTKSFANMAAADPVGAMLSRNFASFSRVHKARARLMWTGKRARLAAWQALHRLGLK